MNRLVLIFIIILGIHESSYSQISMTPDEVREKYGDVFQAVQYDYGILSMMYQQPANSKASGTFIQKKIMFFKKASDDVYYCHMFQLLEPSTETPINAMLYDRDITKIGQMKWRDETNGVVYRIDEKEGACIITAWFEKEQKEEPKTFHF